MGRRVLRFYTLPAFDYWMGVDLRTHELFMDLYTAVDERELDAPMRQLGMYTPDADYPGGERLSLPRCRCLYTQLAGIAVLEHSLFGHYVICFCRVFWPKHGQCCHELFVRYLECDQSINMAPTSQLTRGAGSQRMENLNAERRARA